MWRNGRIRPVARGLDVSRDHDLWMALSHSGRTGDQGVHVISADEALARVLARLERTRKLGAGDIVTRQNAYQAATEEGLSAAMRKVRAYRSELLREARKEEEEVSE